MANESLSSLTAATAATGGTLYGIQSGNSRKFSLTAAGATLAESADVAAQKTALSLSNVDNTSDANKPVSTATQTALDLKLALAGGTMTGALIAGAGVNLRNSTTSQELRVYKTYDGTNDEWFSSKWNSNTLTLGNYATGTGSVRPMKITGSPVEIDCPVYMNLLIGGGNRFGVGGGLTSYVDHKFVSYMDVAEIAAPSAPSANYARIYSKDNGAGKTQLMVRFATGAEQQIAIEP